MCSWTVIIGIVTSFQAPQCSRHDTFQWLRQSTVHQRTHSSKQMAAHSKQTVKFLISNALYNKLNKVQPSFANLSKFQLSATFFWNNLRLMLNVATDNQMLQIRYYSLLQPASLSINPSINPRLFQTEVHS